LLFTMFWNSNKYNAPRSSRLRRKSPCTICQPSGARLPASPRFGSP
jgi:hypothetical protein